MNPHEKKLMGNVKSYDKAPREFQAFSRIFHNPFRNTHANLYFGESNTELYVESVIQDTVCL